MIVSYAEEKKNIYRPIVLRDLTCSFESIDMFFILTAVDLLKPRFAFPFGALNGNQTPWETKHKYHKSTEAPAFHLQHLLQRCSPVVPVVLDAEAPMNTL